nr:polymer-forming cytoskeletal protein [Duganella margarita]
MLRRGRWGMAAAALLLAGVASAANVNFNGSNTVPICPLTGTVYKCAALPLGTNDTAVISSGYTVIISGDVSLAYAQGLSMSGSAVLQSTGNIDLSASNGLNVTGGTLAAAGNFKLGASAQSITANVTAATLTTAGASTYIGGSVTTSGDINLGSSTTITGAVTTTGTGSLTTGSSTTLGPVTVKGSINLSSSNTINGAVSATSITTNSSVTINGSLTLDNKTSNGVADLGSGIKVNGSISAYTVQTNSPATLNGDVNASNSFTLGSGSSVTGNITSPVVTLNASNITVKGDITATTSLDMGSGTAITGKVETGGLTMRASNAVINGNTKVNGDVDMGSGTTINGDLSARNVVTRSSNAIINGNASVNAIYIDWGNSVSKTITCTGPGASGCSCVTKADSNYKPTCGPPAASAPHHFQITHSGSGLTCQPSAVTVRACADAACSTVYTGNAQAPLTPNGGTVTVSGDTAASVSYPTPATVTLSAGAGTTCVNSGANNTSCDMVFAANGLQLSAPDHVSLASGISLSIQALKAAPNNNTCVPLVQGKAKISFSCGYLDPATGSKSLTLGGNAVSCNGGATAFDVTLDSSGFGTLALQYPDVGQMSIKANYTGASGTGANGSTSFTAAPAKFVIVATADPQTPAVTMADSAFARSGDIFRLKVKAQNANGDATENFGLEKSAETISMSTLLLKLPSDGDNPQLGKAQGLFDAIVNGVANSKTDSTGQWQFSETGVVTINATLGNNTGFYMRKTNIAGFRTTGTLDLRFAPHHFDVVVLPGAPMNCAFVGGYSNPCAADTSSAPVFVYSQQPFGVQVKAYKDAANLSKNYRAKTVAADTDSIVRPITLSAAKAAGGVPSTDFVTFTPGQFAFGFAGGVGTLSAASPALTFIAPQAPPVPPNTTVTTSGPTTIYLRAVDTYNATSARAGAVEPPLTVVSGRMMLSNAFGPATTNLPVEAQARYYSGASGAWLLNPAFPGTPASGSVTLATDSATFSTCTGSVLCSSLQLLLSAPPAAATTLSFKSGKGMFTVAAPKATGRAKIKLNPGLFPYLPMYDEGNLTFGVSRSGPVIYTREVYN